MKIKDLMESTGLECEFIEPEPGKWYYVLEDDFGSKNAWDWREEARAFGPFASQEEAHRHLSDNHANPGGYNVVPHDHFRPEKVYDQLIADAPRMKRAFSRW